MITTLAFALVFSASGSGLENGIGRPARALPSALTKVRFVENRGQWDEPVRFAARVGPQRISFERDAWTVGIAGTEVALRFTPTAVAAELRAEKPRQERLHFALGRRQVHGARCFARLRYELREGVALVFRDATPRASTSVVEYDLELDRPAALAGFEMRVEGATLRIDAQTGELVCRTSDGELRHSAPVTFGRRRDGSRVPLRARFRLLDETRYTFDLLDDHDGAVVIDPGLVWSSYHGGSGGTDGIFDLQVAKDGSTFVCGYTDSVIFPITRNALQPRYGGGALDGFVARIAADGKSLLWCSYIGGNREDSLIRLKTAPDGSLWCVGYTSSTNFPTKSPIQASLSGGVQDCAIARFTDKGALLFSTYLGGTQREVARGIGFDTQGLVYVGGLSSSVNYPTTKGVYQATHGGSWDAFATCIDAAKRRIVWSTFVGGSGIDDVWGMTTSGAGEVTLGLTTQSRGLSTTAGALGARWVGGTTDGYLIRLDKKGAKSLAATYLGGGGDDRLNSMRLLDDGSVALVGWSNSTNLPTRDARQARPIANFDGYLARIDSGFKSLVWGTYLGGRANDFLWDLHIDVGGTWSVVGLSYSSDFPVTVGAYKTTIGRRGSNGGDVVVARIVPWLRPYGRQLTYASFVGGADFEYGYAIDVRRHVATIAGETFSKNYEVTPGAFQRTQGGGAGDAMVTRLDLLPASCTRFGDSSPCRDDIPFEPTAHAFRGNASFAMISGRAPVSSSGILALGVPTNTAFPVLGANLHLDPRVLLLTFPMISDAQGRVEVTLPLPNSALRFGLQAFFLRAANCVKGGQLTSTAAIAIDVK